MGIKYIQSLNKICINKNIRTVQLVFNNTDAIDNIDNTTNNSSVVYFLNYTRINDNKQNTNKTALIQNETIIHNMYNSKNVFYKTNIYNDYKTEKTDTAHDYINQFYQLKQPLTQIEKYGNTIYSYDKLTTIGHVNLHNIDNYLYILNNYYNKLSFNKIKTIIFDKIKLKKYLQGININIEKNIFEHIHYNHILEFSSDNITDYDSGNYIAYIFKTKNELNSLYSMHNTDDTIHSSLCNPCTCEYNNMNIALENIQTQSHIYDLIFARKYVGIIVNDNNIYLKYYDNIKYDYNSDEYEELSAGQYGFKFPHIEQIATISREISPIKNKSTVFSLKINNILSHLNNQELNADEVNIYITEIKNIIKKIVYKYISINNQLLNITIT